MSFKQRKLSTPSTLLTLLFSAALLATGCQKEESQPKGIRLLAEGFGSTHKAAVNDASSYWIDGETVRINGADFTVHVSDAGAWVSDVDEPADGIYRALYPNTLNASAPLTGTDVNVTIPSVYVYRTHNGLQALDLPMAAYGTSGDQLFFRHLTAAVTVEVANNFGIDIMVDSIVVSSDSYQISGSLALSLDGDFTVLPNGSPASDADRRVVVRFNGGTTLTVASGDTARVQVPVLPVGDGNHFSITVATHNADEPLMQYTFSRTQTTGGPLARRQLAYALASFGGVFTINDNGDKVRFAPGNLQYYCSTSTPQWRFALHQYDNATYNNSYYNNNTGEWIDLFGFATSGYDSKQPYYKDDTKSRYTPASGTNDISKTEYDWGWHNAIINGGNATHLWRILTADEWAYIKNNHPSRIGLGTINGTRGLVLLPDNWTLPSGCSFVSGVTNNNYTVAQWAKMEVAGAIFLPSNGFRDPKTRQGVNNCYYWTEKFLRSTSKASYITFDATSGLSVMNDPGIYNYYGHSVRPVRDVE